MTSSDTSRPPTANDSPAPSTTTTSLTSSPSSSASLHPAAGTGPGAGAHDTFDDSSIWGSAPPSPGLTPQQQQRHPGSYASADVARLRSTHTSAGYRDGLAAAKEAALQPGFDQGYSLGAALGVKAGAVVGVLQVLAAAVVPADGGGEGEGGGGDGREAVVQFKSTARQCQDELHRSSLLGDEYIDDEGLWKWPVPEGADVLQVAAAHPLIHHWQARADMVCKTLGVSVDKLEKRWLDEPATEDISAKISKVAQKQARQEDGQAPLTKQILDF